ncbi:MAG: hypothetical protein NC204_04770 [Candidatus Amulumruptor caecigallinarius]|nr:hypothetical protein [Candidatus Amulumruptor caecigallinarius]
MGLFFCVMLTVLFPSPIRAEEDEGHGVLIDDTRGNLYFSHFTWGAEIGSSIDVTGNDMSTFDVDVALGYKNDFIKLAGIGAGIHHSIHAGNNLIPLYVVLRTSFRKQPSLLFFDVKAGYSFNTISGSDTMGDFYASTGVGINLGKSFKAKPYIVLSCAYQRFSDTHLETIYLNNGNIFFANLVFGVNF